jgi:septal ring factor EnvC (AmiA/AmiB activator)
MVSMTADAAAELSKMAVDSNSAVESSLHALNRLSDMISTVDQSSQALQASVKSGLNEIASVTVTMAEIREKAKIINMDISQKTVELIRKLKSAAEQSSASGRQAA